jgi:hypothetical protein
MEEELTGRIVKLEKELKSAKYLVIFLILMFIVLAYQFITVQQKSRISVDLVQTRGLIIQDKYGNDILLMGSPLPYSQGRKRTEPSSGMVLMDSNGNDRLFLGQTGSLQIGGSLYSRISDGWGLLVNDSNGDERAVFGILDSLNSMVLGLNYPESEAIKLVSQPTSAFIQINSDSEDYPGERILLLHERGDKERSIIRMGDNEIDDKILIKTSSGIDPSLEFHKKDGSKINLLE